MRSLKRYRPSAAADLAYRVSRRESSISNVTGQPTGFSLTPNVSAGFAGRSVYGLGAMSIGYGGQGAVSHLPNHG